MGNVVWRAKSYVDVAYPLTYRVFKTKRDILFSYKGEELCEVKKTIVANDVIIATLRNSPDSSIKGKVWTFELNHTSGSSIYIPAGFAHGYQALYDNTIVQYVQSGPYRPDFEAGILWSSFEHEWPIANPILSDKDSHLPPLSTC